MSPPDSIFFFGAEILHAVFVAAYRKNDMRMAGRSSVPYGFESKLHNLFDCNSPYSSTIEFCVDSAGLTPKCNHEQRRSRRRS